MFKLDRYIILFFLTFVIGFCSSTFADNREGTKTYDDYLFILIHGVNSDKSVWDGTSEIPKYEILNLKHELEKPVSEGGLGFEGRVYCYTFDKKNGDNIQHARELGDREYNNPKAGMNGECWLEKAREDFIAWFQSADNKKNNPTLRPPTVDEIPSKYIFVTHSMGNYAARAYIYSDYLKNKETNIREGFTYPLHPVKMFDYGFYQGDVDKVVFIAPPFNGSDLAYIGVMPKAISTWFMVMPNKIDAWRNILLRMCQSNGIVSDPYVPYKLSKEISFGIVQGDNLMDLMLKTFRLDRYKENLGISGIGFDLESGMYGALDHATWDLFPTSAITSNLRDAKLPEDVAAPAYSVIYGQGIPVFRLDETIKNHIVLAGTEKLFNYNYFDSYFNKSDNIFSMLHDEFVTMSGSGFWGLSTNQAKFYSLLLSNPFGASIEDGDNCVPVSSAKPDNIPYLRNASYYAITHKTDEFERYLSETFPNRIEQAAAFYLFLTGFAGVPDRAAFIICEWIVVLEFVGNVTAYQDDLRNTFDAHTLGNMRNFNLIKTAILDTPAILCVNDLQTTRKATGTSEVIMLSFSVSSPEAGYRSLKVMSITEARNYTGTIEMAVPSTLNDERRYMTTVTVKEAPTRIAGKLNYLVPKLMKKFEYSFNFAAWKPITKVDPVTGEFYLDNLPFAEGQNILAARAVNAVDIESHQLLKIILNTIPMVPSELSPLPGTFTNDSTPTFSGKFAKASYSSDPLENVSLTTAKLIKGSRFQGVEGSREDQEEVDVTAQVNTTIGGGDYDKYLNFSYTPQNALPDGDYSLMVSVDSNVGVSQAVINVTIDTRAPAIAMREIPPYSPRAPTTIQYVASDEASPVLKDVRCDLYRGQDFVTNIATSDSLSKGENFFILDPRTLETLPAGQAGSVPDGNYSVRIKVCDLAGNYATSEQPIKIDSTPPQILSVSISPQPMTSAASEMKLTARVSEQSAVMINMKNTLKDTTSTYLTKSSRDQGIEGSSCIANYIWNYDSMFAKGPEDGIYQIELKAVDEAGNESAPKTLEAVRIDRTSPVISGQIANPYVLANTGADAYRTTLSYHLRDQGVEGSRDQEVEVKIEIYNSNSGQLVDTIEGAPASLTEENKIIWIANSTSLPKGAYRFEIIAKDRFGNTAKAYASCVKDGIAPVISYPAQDSAEVCGTISIRGTAIDPDWTNGFPFKRYRVYYSQGNNLIPGCLETLTPEWMTNAIEVPLINRDPEVEGARYQGIRPVQNDSTLAYLHTNLLPDGEYTLLVVVEEEGGESIAARRIINVKNDDDTAQAIASPYIKLKPLPSQIEFKSDDSIKLPIEFINSIKPANVYVEILKVSRDQGVEGSSFPVFFKYFATVPGAPFTGKPEYQPGADLGYFIWMDENGYHIRWSTDGSSHHFTGSLVSTGGKIKLNTDPANGLTVSDNFISWDTNISGAEGGLDFKASSGQLIITSKIDEDANDPSIYAENVYLGISKQTQEYLPVMIDAAGQKLVDFASMGESENEQENLTLVPRNLSLQWDGRLDTGAFADNGSYIVRVRAEGVDGIGVAEDESVVRVSTPYDLSLVNVTPADKTFSTVGALAPIKASGPDRVSINYTVSKDSIVNAYAYDENNEFISTIVYAEKVPGVNQDNPHVLSWKGNYPEADSGLLVGPGTYKIVLNAASRDGSREETITVDNISVKSFSSNADLVSLDPIGQEVDFHNGSGLERIRLATGDSPYFIEAKGIGTYYPPKDFTYTLTVDGKQRITAYPYVPFAGLMHRGFKQLDLKAKIKLKYYMKLYCYIEGKKQNLPWYSHSPYHGGWIDDLIDIYTAIKEDNFEENFYLNLSSPESTLNFDFNIKDRIDAMEQRNIFVEPIGEANYWAMEIEKVKCYVEIWAKDGSFKLDNIENWIAPGFGAKTIKGVFDIGCSGEKYEDIKGWVNDKGAFFPEKVGNDFIPITLGNFKGSVNVRLEAEIPYSRLTNRFVPWYGFINARSPLSERTKDFSVYLADINQGLGFPGKLFFDDPEAKPGEPYMPEDELVAQLQAMSWSEMVAHLSTEAQTANLFGYKDSLASSIGYDSYLADEYFEFIPITNPPGGAFEYDNNSSLVRVNTSLVYPAQGADGRISPFEFSWPLKDTEMTAFNMRQEAKQDELRDDPQKYTGTSATGTWWQLDEEEKAIKSAEQHNSKIGSGQIRFDKNVGKTIWQSPKLNAELLPPPDYVYDLNYSVKSETPEINVSISSSGKNGRVLAEGTEGGISWSTLDDKTLAPAAGLIKSEPLIFNEDVFLGCREVKIADHYKVSDDYQSGSAYKYTFLKYDPFTAETAYSPIDNPNVVINDWQISVKDRSGKQNKDILLEEVQLSNENGPQSHYLNDKLKLKLNLKASEARFVELSGKTPGSYELMFFDGNAWNPIFSTSENQPGSGRLAWWDVSRLNGQYTVLLKSQNLVASQDINIGTLIKKDVSSSAWSTYKRAQLKFPAEAFINGSALSQDQLVTITPVSVTEIKIRNRPILLTHGPIVEIKPSPWEFEINPEDKRPTLRFLYTLDDLEELGVYNRAQQGIPEVGAQLGIPWNIHQVTAAGDLQVISGNQQELENNNGEYHYVFYAPLDHFSTYTLLEGKFSLSAPIVLADRYITNQETVTIYGTAEPGSVLNLYVKAEDVIPDPATGETYAAQIKADEKTGSFKIEKVRLIQEGQNYIFVTSHLEENTAIRTISNVVVVKDTVPPEVVARANLYAFSPNGDGRYEAIDYFLTVNEKGKVYFQVSSLPAGQAGDQGFEGASGGGLFSQEILAEANKEVKVTWGQNDYNLIDGEYLVAVFAIDEAGNISNNVILKAMVDNTPPAILNASASPNPFTPNEDGINDTTTFKCEFSEPTYMTLKIFREDGALFNRHEGSTEGFVSSSLEPLTSRTLEPSAGLWVWNGRGSRNELLGGTYNYIVQAEDWVGNLVTSEAKTIVVDREPSLIPYAYAKPDPFSPINPNNNFTEIKYYLARDDLDVSVDIIGEGEKIIKALTVNEIQGGGEHSVKWYGDFDSGYPGATAIKDQTRVGDGSYVFRVSARDINEEVPAKVTNTVLVDNTPPHTSLGQVKVDSLLSKASLTYTIAEQVTLIAEVYDENDNLIAAPINSEAKSPGNYILEYEFASGGTYFFKFTATDKALNVAENKSESFVITSDGKNLSITNLSAIPNPFTPNGDGHTDLTRIAYQISGGAPDYTVNINILNEIGTTIKSLIVNEPQSAAFYWDGTDDSRLVTRDGYYSYIITALDKQGAKIEAQGQILVVSTRPAVDLSASLALFSPNGDGVKDTVRFDYSLDYSTAYITGEALVKLEIINSANEVVWEKIFNHTAGSYFYEYDGSLTPGSLETLPAGQAGSIPPGDYYVRILAEDALGSTAVPKTVNLRVDNENQTVEMPKLTIDITSPEVRNLNINPNPAPIGELIIGFDVSEALNEAPVVYVTQNGATSQMAIVSGSWGEAGGHIEARHQVVRGYDGPALINIELEDLANNQTNYQTGELVIDTIAPVFTNIWSEIATNPDFSNYAKEGSGITIRFRTSEELQFNPDVRVNGNLTEYAGLIVDEYSYSYTVTSGDDEGNATITISGMDFAGNEGIAETSSSSESFVIDLVNPTVIIAPEDTPEMIANPGKFSTNANPDGSDIPRSTTFYYTLAEYSNVSVKVHKVANEQTSYVKEDFHAGNQVETLILDVWQSGGIERTVPWDGGIESNIPLYDTNSDGYADPGKYAFIVEGRDRAGNLTLKKWGGTVWIQNNVLSLREPDQLEYDNAGLNPRGNPDPPIISPSGNSLDPTQKRARYYFVIDLSQVPPSGVVTSPERIEAFAVMADTKRVGKYSVKVYGDSALNNLVRTVVSNADAQSGTLTWEDWDGKNDEGGFVLDGTYYIVVDVRDYAGNAANGNLLTRPVIIDNSPPGVSNLSVSPYYFSPGTTDSTLKITSLGYEVSDNSGRNKVTIDVYLGDRFVKTITSEFWMDNGSYAEVWDGSVAGGGYAGTYNGSGFSDGIYKFNIYAFDEAGNRSAEQLQEVVVDTLKPTFEAIPAGRDWAAANIEVASSVSGGDSGIKTAEYAWSSETSLPTNGWNGFSEGQTLTQVEDGQWYLHFRAEDNAGNPGSLYYGFYQKDSLPPEISADPVLRDWAASSILVTLRVSDAYSGIDLSQYAWSANTSIPDTGWNNFLNGNVINQVADGNWYLHVRATDITGNRRVTYFGPYKKDSAPPTVVDRPTTSTPTKNRMPTWNWLSSNDILSGVAGYYIKVGTAAGGDDVVTETWVGDVSSWETSVSLSDGTYYASIKARDNAGNISSYGSNGTVVVDLIPPQITGVGDSPDPFSPGNIDGNKDSITINYSINEASTVSIYIDGTRRYNVVKTSAGSYNFPWSPGTSISEGAHSYYIQARDLAGNTRTSATYNFVVDNTSPRINGLYLNRRSVIPDGINNSLNISFEILGANDIDIQIKNQSGAVVKNFPNVSGPVTWDARSDFGSLVGVGYYSVYLVASDLAGNSANISKPVRVRSRDEIAVSDDNIARLNDIRTVYLNRDYSFGSVYWETPVAQDMLRGACLGDFIGDSKPLFVALVPDAGATRIYVFDLRNKTIVNSKKFARYPCFFAAGDFNGDNRDELAVIEYERGSPSWVKIYSINSGGWFLLKQWRTAVGCWVMTAGDFDGDGKDELAIIDDNGTNAQTINLYRPDEVIDGATNNPFYAQWTTPYLHHPGVRTPDYADELDYFSAPTIAAGDVNGDGRDDIAVISSEEKSSLTFEDKLYVYQASGQLINSFIINDYNDSFRFIEMVDCNGDEIHELAVVNFIRSEVRSTWMKIYNPLNGSILNEGLITLNCWLIAAEDVDCAYKFTSVMSVPGKVLKEQSVSSFEAPALISPENETEVRTLRPTFEWQHQKGRTQEYKVELAKNDSFTIDFQSFSKSANAGSADKDDPALYHFTYQIHEFDPGLDRDTYYWRVSAISSDESAASQIWSFTVAPKLALTKVTNYPNPFNPNRETTRIRYRLGADADEVKIRIYDIAGSLVKEITNCPTEGEGSSIRDKYQDVEWDGRNGRGDLVVNGIYPFEITARLGDKSVLAKGKIAVLK